MGVGGGEREGGGTDEPLKERKTNKKTPFFCFTTEKTDQSVHPERENCALT